MGLIVSVLVATLLGVDGQEPKDVSVALVVGPDYHAPGTHEALAGGKLLAWTLNHLTNVEGVSAKVYEGWPEGSAELKQAKSVVFLGDLFPPEVVENREQAMRELGAMMDKGAGLVALHYATGITGDKVGEDGDHPLLHWSGGYFANPGSTHHESVGADFSERED